MAIIGNDLIGNDLIGNDLIGNDLQSLVFDKAEARRIVAEQNAISGFVPDPTATAQRGRARMLAQGVKPEDRIGSAGIIAARDEN